MEKKELRRKKMKKKKLISEILEDKVKDSLIKWIDDYKYNHGIGNYPPSNTKDIKTLLLEMVYYLELGKDLSKLLKEEE